MTISSTVQAVGSADNVTGHVATAGAIGAALASIVGWGFQLGHVVPPPEVVASFGVIFSVLASYVMQRVSTAPAPG